MIKKYNNMSLLLGVPGLIMQMCVFIPNLKLIGLIGAVLVIIGLAYYAKSIGRHPAWGLLGLLSWIGLFILMLFKDKTLSPEEESKPKKSSLVFRIAITVFLVFVLFVVLCCIFAR